MRAANGGLMFSSFLKRLGKPGKSWRYERRTRLDLGIAGRKAIWCASCRRLGRGCALALAAAGCEVVINGRDGPTVDAAAADIPGATGANVIAVVADVGT